MTAPELTFYEDDEGISVDLVLSAFGENPVQCINLDADTVDKKYQADIHFLIKNQNAFFEKITEEAREYCQRVYGCAAKNLLLIKIYLSPETEKIFGFMFSVDVDPEHGLGLKFNGLQLMKTGSSEAAFL
ncbi:hypothetical protein RA241_004137 [Cronobacter sakazakii]|uniref:hypothetical protein n=1 Tax=Cronobacter sakazakii TaxID=28141 RepID=UPI000CF14C40|nr:hypothetical protein [Cronobacter sakazakii]EIX1505077.1 hypothetical protein [Cronobacter sakazakii]EIX1526799.1 hypothetical protein [Cronobacter sakazakii]EIX1623940.1 hypothetical protein [Cronobacter sakazakii]EIX1665411.1 hypothetical protein [Cronobacter sakazakii]EIX1673580.1 hypothetical protein [Cronobacter sakazakii]